MTHPVPIRPMASARGIVIAALFFITAMAASPAFAQVIEPLQKPNLNLVAGGTVYAIARQPDGGTIIGGQFTSVNGVPRQNIARRKPDGSLDTEWNPSIDGPVRALAVDHHGDVYAGGEFSTVDGLARQHLVKLSGGGGDVVTGWNASTDGIVLSITASNDSIFAGGIFRQIGGQPRNNLAKVSLASGAVDALWNPLPDSSANYQMVMALEPGHDGSLYVGGSFTTIGGMARRNLAKVSPEGTGAAEPVWDPSPNDTVRDIAVASDGSVFITGSFWAIGNDFSTALLRWSAAKLSGSGEGVPDASWDPIPGGQVLWALEVAVGTDGSVYLGGGMYGFVLVKASANGSGAIDTSWNPAPRGVVYAIEIGAGGSVLAGGTFHYASDEPRLSFATIDASGTAGTPFDIEAAIGRVNAFALQPDGAVIVGGNFMKADGHIRRHLLRLLPDGSLDPDWSPDANALVMALASGPDGAVYAGGYFTTVNGAPRSGLVKLAGNGNGAVFTDWNPPIQAVTQAITVDAEGHVFAGGLAMIVAGSATTRTLIKLSSYTAAVDLKWNPRPNGQVTDLFLDGGGQLFVGGNFSSIGGETRLGVAKVSATEDGLADPIWNPVASGRPRYIAFDGSAWLYLSGGSFRLTGHPGFRGFSRISATGAGSLDTTWNPEPFNGASRHIELDPAGFIYSVTDAYVGGDPSDTDFKLSRHSTNDAGTLDTSWLPASRGYPGAMRYTSGKLLVGGSFTHAGSQLRISIAALPTTIPDVIFGNGFESQ